MTNEVKTDETQEILGAISEISETKADKSALDTKANTTDLEAFIKSSEMTEKLDAIKADLAAKGEALEAFKAETENKFKAAIPAIIKEAPMGLIKFGDIDHFGQTVQGQKFNVITKAVGDNTDIAGGRVDTNSPYYLLEQANFARQYGTLMPASGGVIKLPDLSGVSWASEATQPENPSRTPGGTLASKNVITDTYISENSLNLASLNDVPNMDGVMVNLMATQLGKSEAAEAVSTVKAETDANLAATIKTGVAAGLPTNANVFGKMVDMISGLSTVYTSGARFLVSRALYGVISQSNNTGINFDPTRNVVTLAGFPVHQVEELEASNVANNLVALFGDFSRGLVLATSAEMSVGRYEQTRPGAMTYFGHTRFKHAVWNAKSLVQMTVGT